MFIMRYSRITITDLYQKNMEKRLTKWRAIHTYWLILFIFCVLVQLLNLTEGLRFDRQHISQGDIWLLISGNLAHLNWNHLFLNMAALLMVSVFFSSYLSMLVWVMLSLWCALLVGLGLYYFNPEVFWYVGLSGVLHGFFLVGAWYEYKRYKVSGLVLLVLIVGKLIWEKAMGALPGSESVAGGHVIVDAHLYGAIAGALFLIAAESFSRSRKRDA